MIGAMWGGVKKGCKRNYRIKVKTFSAQKEKKRIQRKITANTYVP